MLPVMKPYSTDLRQRVLAAYERGVVQREIVRLYQVSQASLTRWIRLQRISGDLTPKQIPGRARTIPRNQEPQLRQQLDADSDATLATHAARWNADHGTTLSTWTMARAIRRLGWSRKKRR